MVRGVGDGLDVFVFGLGVFLDFYFVVVMKNVNFYGGEKVVGVVGVVVDIIVEDSSGVFVNGRVDEGFVIGVVSNEFVNIVNDVSDGNLGFVVFGFGDKVVLVDNG